MAMLTDFRYALRSLLKARGLSITVVLTLALGIGANAAIFSLVRGVLLKPLVNDDEEKLIYVRQTAGDRNDRNANWSVPEINDLKSRVKTISEFGDFSTIEFNLIGLGEPRVVRAGVVGGSFFRVMGLNAIRGRLIDASDDGADKPSVTVLTHRFWSTTLNSDENILGKQIKLGDRASTIIGVLEPSVPYPAETELMANVVTSSHHMSATMQDGRVHRMTELFGRLAPGATLEQARAELQATHGAIVAEHREAYPVSDKFGIMAVQLRDQITSNARTVLLVLLAASGLIFIIACSNVANLILARSVRREGELAIRAALGATSSALRRTLLAESLVLCGAGALLGVLLARPMVAVLAQYASRYSVRALELTVDSTLLWVGVSLAILSAILLAFVPRLPSTDATNGFGLANGSVRITSGTNQRLRLFAVTQIAASFLLVAGSGALLATLVALQRQDTGVNMRNVLAVHVPLNYERPPEQTLPLYREALRQIGELPGVQQVAIGTIVPWREAGAFFDAQFMVEGYAKANGEEDPRASFRTVSPGFFQALGVQMIAGRDFNADDKADGEKVVIISDSLAKRMFPNQDAVNRTFMWTDPVMKFIGISTGGRRIVGVVDDLDDENLVPGKKLTVYHPMEQEFGGGRLFVHAGVDPYSLVTPITKIIRGISAEQPVEQAATLEDVRAEVLAPNRLNTLVFGGFAIVALTIAIVGVAGVLAFSVSARMREFGVRLAIGSTPSSLLAKILGEGAVIAAAGIVTGVIGGFALLRFAGGFFGDITVPGWAPLAGAAVLLIVAAVAASLMPAARASRVDVVQALRSE